MPSNTEFPKATSRNDPYRNFRFRLKWDGRYVAGVSKVSGLARTTQVITHRAGGDPTTPRRTPGQSEYGSITLERGVTYDVAFEQWANKVWDYHNLPIDDQQGGASNQDVSLKDFRKDIVLEVYNESGQKVIAYNIYRCWPSEFAAVPRWMPTAMPWRSSRLSLKTRAGSATRRSSNLMSRPLLCPPVDAQGSTFRTGYRPDLLVLPRPSSPESRARALTASRFCSAAYSMNKIAGPTPEAGHRRHRRYDRGWNADGDPGPTEAGGGPKAPRSARSSLALALRSKPRSMMQRCEAGRWSEGQTDIIIPVSVTSYTIRTVPSSSPVATIGERPFPRSVRNILAFAADIRRQPSVFADDEPTASATMWTVMLARAMAGSSGMTLNVRTMPLPRIKIGVYGCRTGGLAGGSPAAGAEVDCVGFTLHSSTGKSGLGAPGGAPRIGAKAIKGFLLCQRSQRG